jgi:hypothetical protein
VYLCVFPSSLFPDFTFFPSCVHHVVVDRTNDTTASFDIQVGAEVVVLFGPVVGVGVLVDVVADVLYQQLDHVPCVLQEDVVLNVVQDPT